MTGREAIEYIHSRLAFGSVPGLERISLLCEKIGNPQDKMRFIHVAGTNGKGSTSTMISEMLINAGYKTGLYTSPYVVDFRERIQLNGKMIPEKDLGEITEIVKKAADEMDEQGESPTEFEILTAIALLYYYKSGCDVAVIEVGMGGLQDSTNIIENTDVCVITSISYDHTAVLGNTIEEIAANKAGIIKDNCAVAVYPQIFSEAFNVIFDTANEKNCPLYVTDKEKITVIRNDAAGTEFIYKGRNIKTQLMGEHQIYNAATAFDAGLAMIDKGFDIKEENIINGIYNAQLPARVQIISRDPMIVIDGGHNEDGVSALCKAIKTSFMGYKITAVVGMMKDKDVDAAVMMLAPLCEKIYTVTVNNPRSISAEELKEKVLNYCKNAEAFSDAQEAFRKAKSEIKKGEMLLVSGSLYLASEIMKQE